MTTDLADASSSGAKPARELEAEELRIGFPGDILFADGTGVPRLRLEDAPTLGFALELVDTVRAIRKGARSKSFVDFYDEFEIELARLEDGGVRIRNTYANEEFETTLEALEKIVQAWARSLVETLESAHEGVTENPDYLRMRSVLLAV